MSAELVACPNCNRNNNALRQNCIYCGAALPAKQQISFDALAAHAEQVGKGEKVEADPLSNISVKFQQNQAGFNVGVLPMPAEKRQKTIELIAGLTPFNDVELKQLLDNERGMPIARFPYEVSAKALYDKLQSIDLPSFLISDKVLQPDQPNRRSKRLIVDSVGGTKLTSHNENQVEAPITIAANEIRLIIEGRVRYWQSQASEQNKGFGKTERELTDAVEFIEEVTIIDIYTSSLSTSLRVRTDNFDYSGLGTKMKLTANENMRMLVNILREIAPDATYDNEFRQQSKLLELVWPSEGRKESLGLRRSKMLTAGKITTLAAYHNNNEMQFNRYSRMRFFLLPDIFVDDLPDAQSSSE